MSTPLWLQSHLTRPLTIVQRVPSAAPDEHGNVVYDENRVDATGYLGPLTESEIQGGRAEVGLFLLVLDQSYASLVDGFAGFEIDGVMYEAIGAAAVPSSLSTNNVPHHVEFTVQASSA